MSRYRVEVLPAALRSLRKVDPSVARRLQGAIALLSEDPRPPSSKALVARPGRFRVRVGDYRIIYSIQHDVLLVLVIALGHRREIYDR